MRQRLEPLFRENFAAARRARRRAFRSGSTAGLFSICTADFAMRGGNSPGPQTRSCCSGRRRKGSALPVCCTCCRSTRSDSNGAWRSSGRSLRKAARARSRSRSSMSHQAGLCALDERVDVLDYAAVIRALERQAPLWPPGTAHGYHARTFGYLLDELTRRISGADDRRILARSFRRADEARHLDRSAGIGARARRNNVCREGRQSRRSQSSFTAISPRRARWCARRLPRRRGCMRSAG